MALWGGGRLRACRSVLKGKQVWEKAFCSGRGYTRDPELEAILKDAPPPLSSTNKASAAKSSSGPDFWKTLTADPPKNRTSSQGEMWDFLPQISPTFSKAKPRSDTPSLVGTSFRKIGDRASGFDFLSEAIDRPEAPVKSTEAEEAEEESIMKSASFKLIRDTFQQKQPQEAGTKGLLDNTLGFDSSPLLSSQFSQALGARSLQDFDGSNFYSVQDHSPAEDAKTYSYEELGQKLRQTRPPTEQLLSSATGLSFGELLARFRKIEELEEEDGRGSQSDYKALKDGLVQLQKTTLSSEDMVFLNNFGSTTNYNDRIEYTPPNDHLLTKYYSDTQLSSKERVKLEIKKWRAEFQTHECDSGSPQVQIAILTARINNLNRHMREGPNLKRDKHTKKGLNAIVHHRKRLLRYLRRRDWPVYCNVLTKLKLDDIILEKRR